MAIPVKRDIKVLEAQYVRDANSILIVGECKEGRLRHQIHRSCFSFGNRTEEQIVKEMEKTAAMMVGKTLTMVFDPDLQGKIKDKVVINYK